MADRHAPFSAHKKGSVRACGTISEVRIHEDGKTARVTVRHKAPPVKPKKGKEGMIGEPFQYPEETSATMPAEHAKRFRAGQAVSVHIGPAGEVGEEESAVHEAGEETSERKPGKKTGDLIRRALAKGEKGK